MTKGLTIRIANGSIVTLAATILLSAVFWFVPLFLLDDISAKVAFSLMGTVVFCMPLWLSKALAFLYWLAVWYILNLKCKELSIIPVRSVMIFIIGMAFSSAVPMMQRFDGTLVAFLLFLTSFLSIFGLYELENQLSEVFLIMLFILLTSLFVPGYIWLIGVIVLGFINFKVGSPRIVMCMVVVLLMFAWMVWGICFCFDLIPLLKAWLNSMVCFSLPVYHGSIVPLVGAGLLFLAVITVIVSLSGISHLFDARVRLNASFVYLSFFFIVALMIFFPSAFSGMLLVVILFATILSSLLFSVNKSKFSDCFFLVAIFLMFIYRVASELQVLNLEI